MNLGWISTWAGVIDNFMKGLVSGFEYCYLLIVFGLEGVWIVLNHRKGTSDGPGWEFVLNTYRFYLGMVNYLVVWYLEG